MHVYVKAKNGITICHIDCDCACRSSAHGMKRKPKHTHTNTFSSKTLRWRPILNRNEAVFAKGKTYVHKAREQTEWNATKLNVICMQNSTEFMSLPLSPAVFCEMR